VDRHVNAYGEAKTNVFYPIARRAFDQALGNLGWIDGRNVRIEYCDAGGELERLRGLAIESVKFQSRLDRCP
jgi:hypothetical protein